ncbi:hypothetical protein EVAR_24236_1 [Eumeta japonica]|uniref:Uncharacterized protein n=1 Tax=Eumeta variegata TaxID=151549 RepID=A0A4C1W673_EUMVA|nr:hypothetical protein EVAR_24236_1 [Eumeta japonica]
MVSAMVTAFGSTSVSGTEPRERSSQLRFYLNKTTITFSIVALNTTLQGVMYVKVLSRLKGGAGAARARDCAVFRRAPAPRAPRPTRRERRRSPCLYVFIGKININRRWRFEEGSRFRKLSRKKDNGGRGAGAGSAARPTYENENITLTGHRSACKPGQRSPRDSAGIEPATSAVFVCEIWQYRGAPRPDTLRVLTLLALNITSIKTYPGAHAAPGRSNQFAHPIGLVLLKRSHQRRGRARDARATAAPRPAARGANRVPDIWFLRQYLTPAVFHARCLLRVPMTYGRREIYSPNINYDFECGSRRGRRRGPVLKTDASPASARDRRFVIVLTSANPFT